MITAKKDLKEASIEATKILADGTRVPLGTIAYYHKNKFKMLWFYIKKEIKKWQQ